MIIANGGYNVYVMISDSNDYGFVFIYLDKIIIQCYAVQKVMKLNDFKHILFDLYIICWITNIFDNYIKI